MKNRLCIFSHFDKEPIVDDYVHYYLAGLKKIASNLAFVSTASLDERQVTAQLRNLCDSVIIRKNEGYDFASWQTGLLSVGDIGIFDEVILCNDSVYGPLFPLENMFTEMEKIDCNFWGVTENHEGFYHLQSYFLVFKKQVVRSKKFKNFFDSIEAETAKRNIIRKYEIGLTQTLIKAGFKPASYARQVPLSIKIAKLGLVDFVRGNLIKTGGKWLFRKPVNATQYYWKEIISACRAPFIKVELLRDNPNKLTINDVDKFIQEQSNYPVELIHRHLNRVKSKSHSPEKGVDHYPQIERR